MTLSIWSNISEAVTDFLQNVKEFFIQNSRNPFLWIAIIIIGLIVFETVWKALNND